MRIFCLRLLSGFCDDGLCLELLRRLTSTVVLILVIFLLMLSRWGREHLLCTLLFVSLLKHCNTMLC